MDHPRHGLAARHQMLLSAAGWISQHEPSIRAQILARADEALAGRMPIDGSEGEPFFVGNPPAWKELRTCDR